MTTRMYLHSDTSAEAGTLPTTEQSAKTSVVDFESQATNRTMDTTIGGGQTSLALTRAVNTGSNTLHYVSKFISAELDQTSIAANTWRWNFAAKVSATVDDYPTNDLNPAAVPICVYVWRPGTGTKVGNIFDSNTNTGYYDCGTFHQPGNTNEVSEDGTFSGSSVASVQTGDVIILEVWISEVSNTASSRTYSFFYDGTTETLTNGTTVSSHASFLETPETLVFVSAGGGTTNRQYNSFTNTGFMPSVASVTF